MAKSIEIEVNGKKYPVYYDPETPLLFVLRDELGLTGSKYGCGEGQCGACTVSHAGPVRYPCVQRRIGQSQPLRDLRKTGSCIRCSKRS